MRACPPHRGWSQLCLRSAETDIVTRCAISSYETVQRLLSKNTGVVEKRNALATQAPIFWICLPSWWCHLGGTMEPLGEHGRVWAHGFESFITAPTCSLRCFVLRVWALELHGVCAALPASVGSWSGASLFPYWEPCNSYTNHRANYMCYIWSDKLENINHTLKNQRQI